MAGIQIVTDSTAYISKVYTEMNHIKVAPLNVHFEGEVFEEGFPGEFEAFYRKLENSKDFPKTSQPSVDVFKEIFEEALAKEQEVIVIVLSSELSGTMNSAYVAAQMTDPDKISIVDSQITAANLRVLVERASEMAQRGFDRAKIVERIESDKMKMGVNLTVETLDNLKRGGRLTNVQAFIGTILNVRPIIAVKNGKLEPIGKVRGKNKAIEMMVKNITPNVQEISVCHTVNESFAYEVRDELAKQFPNAKMSVDELGPVIGAHLGPKAIGICWTW